MMEREGITSCAWDRVLGRVNCGGRYREKCAKYIREIEVDCVMQT